MPNLFTEGDFSEYLPAQIERYYDFNVVNIDSTEYILKYGVGRFRNVDSFFYLLTNRDNQHLAILRLEPITIAGKVYHQIKKSFSVSQRIGHGSLLYEYSFRHHQESIVSDSTNSIPGSYNLWKKLLKNNQFQIHQINKNTGRKIKIAEPLDVYSVWGLDPDLLPLIDVVFLDDYYRLADANEEEHYFDNDNFTNINEYMRKFIMDASDQQREIQDRANTLLLFDKTSSIRI